MRRWILLTVFALQLGSAAALAQQPRPVQLPENARYGELKGVRYPEAKIGDKLLRLAPGARVFNQQNLIIMPATMPQQGSVLYRLDINGEIMDMWLLTPAEAAVEKKRPRPKP